MGTTTSDEDMQPLSLPSSYDNTNNERRENSSNSNVHINDEVINNDNNDTYRNFIITFLTSKAAVHIIMVTLFYAVGISCTLGIVPDLMSDRYARLDHGYNGSMDCNNYDDGKKPGACNLGADDAVQAASIAAFVKNILTLGCNSIIGRYSDIKGRRGVLIMSTALTTLAPCVLVLMGKFPRLHPFWFYFCDSSTGIINYMSISVAFLSDVMPTNFRAPSFGLLIATFYFCFSIAPSIPLFLDHFQVSIISFFMTLIGFGYTILIVPETLPEHVAGYNTTDATNENNNEASNRQEQEVEPSSILSRMLYKLLLPIQELSILYRNSFLRIIATGSFISGLVYSFDITIVIYYIEEQLGVNDADLAGMFLISGLLGVLLQSVFLKLFIQWFGGEKGLLIITFISGTVHNFLYGIADNKIMIYIAICLSQLTKMNFPILSSLASTTVDENEQGRIQGALFAFSGLANAIGPVIMQYVYKQTKQYKPGIMFLVASALYATGTIFLPCLPTTSEQRQEHKDRREGGFYSNSTTTTNNNNINDDLISVCSREPLLSPSEQKQNI